MQPCEAGGAHHWIIVSPDGRHFLPGKCKLCGIERADFPASGDDERTHWKPHIPGLGRSEVRYVYD
jgi:hypothetical protein